MPDDVHKLSLRERARADCSSVGVVVPLAVLFVWVGLFPLMVPTLRSDRGIFVSVAERILAGDILYEQVWDNKDPLFYLTLALSRSVSPFADIVLEMAWIVGAGLAVYSLMRWMGGTSASSLMAGFAVTPIILTGAVYYPGHTGLPGVTLSLMATSAAISRRYGLAGGLVALLFFFKIPIFPVGFVLVALIVVLRRGWRALISVVAGFLVMMTGVLVLFLLRGEFWPYLDSLAMNVRYSSRYTMIEHLARMASPRPLVVFFGFCSVFAWITWKHPGIRIAPVRRVQTMWLLAVGSFLGAVAVLSKTGIWDHHAQILYVPAMLVVLLVVHWGQSMDSSRTAPAVVSISLLAAVLLSGLFPVPLARAYRDFASSIEGMGDLSEETRAVLSVGSSGTYARVGGNDDNGHAHGLMNWDLVCRRFHQYGSDSPEVLDDLASCLPKAEVIIVSGSGQRALADPDRAPYLDRTSALLASSYVCTEWQTTLLCKRR